MNPDLVRAIVSTLAALGGATGVAMYFGTRLTNRTTREGQFTDDQAEELKALRTELNAVKAELKAERAERVLERQERVWSDRLRDDYTQLLRQHIADGKPPPPPAFPAALTGGGQS